MFMAFIPGWIFVLSLGSLLTGDMGVLRGMVMPLLMIPAALVWLVWRLGRGDKREIVQLIRHTLNAATDEAAA
jgi:hypothetical protein